MNETILCLSLRTRSSLLQVNYQMKSLPITFLKFSKYNRARDTQGYVWNKGNFEKKRVEGNVTKMYLITVQLIFFYPLFFLFFIFIFLRSKFFLLFGIILHINIQSFTQSSKLQYNSQDFKIQVILKTKIEGKIDASHNMKLNHYVKKFFFFFFLRHQSFLFDKSVRITIEQLLCFLALYKRKVLVPKLFDKSRFCSFISHSIFLKISENNWLGCSVN